MPLICPVSGLTPEISATNTPLVGGEPDQINNNVPTTTPEINIILPQPAILVPSSTPIIIPLAASICSNINTPILPQGDIIVNGQCVPDTFSGEFVTNITATSDQVSFAVNTPFLISPQVEYSTSSDMSNAVTPDQQRDSRGNTIDICTKANTIGNIQGTDNTSPVITSIGLDNLVSGTTYYFTVNSYQCGVPGLNPVQLYLGTSDINNFIAQ